MSHTSGPWVVNDVLEGGGGFGEWRVESEHEHGEVNEGWCIASMWGSDGQANAYLVAAAPELLAELRKSLAAWVAIERTRAPIHPLCNAVEVAQQETSLRALRDIIASHRAAIAKARGRT